MVSKEKEISVREELQAGVILRLHEKGTDPDLPPINEDIPEESEDPGVEVVETYLLSDPDCPGCVEAKEAFRDLIESGEVQYVTTNDETGMDIMDEIGWDHTLPALVMKLSNGKYVVRKEE